MASVRESAPVYPSLLPRHSQLAEGEDGPVAAPPRRRDPYRTWISEIMLQQTQVATVVDYFQRWLLRFPDVAALAAADEQDVLEAWAGLGYYSRARNVLATARKVMERHGGRFPWRREDLLDLQGVGEYTAGAIASLAYNLPEPILDGNLVRVFSRLYGLDFLPDSKAGKAVYWELARTWANAHAQDVAAVNEGLMELGALICVPRNPDCARCPLTPDCAAFSTGRQGGFPPVRSRKGTETVAGFAVVALRGRPDGEEALLYTPPKGERLAGLLTFPCFHVSAWPELQAAWRSALPGLGNAALRPRSLTVSHSITHHRYRLRTAEASLGEDSGAAGSGLPDGYAWAPIGELDRLLVSALPKKIWQGLRKLPRLPVRD
jgi:A/G-specific adenine glycosylase